MLSATFSGKTKHIPVLVVPQDTTIHIFDCGYTLSDTTYSFDYRGGSHSFDIIPSSSLCAWSATNTNSWFHISSTTQQMGYGNLTITVDSFINKSSRTGIFKIAGTTYTINQSGMQIDSILAVYPNPSNELIYLRGNGMANGSYNMSLIDMYGKRIIETEHVVRNNFIDRQMNLQGLPSGIYFLIVNSNDKRQVFKISKL
jgi:hypothetical protein